MLRTPAPFIGALGLSLKRALALLAESTFGSRCNGCSLFSLMLEGRHRGRVVVTACVFALLSGLTRAWLVPASMAALKSRFALPCVPSGPVGTIRDLALSDLYREAAEKHYKTEHRNRGFAMAPSRPTGRRHTPNQPMERTPPCCALRRRSSAR